MHHIDKLITQGEGLTIEFKRAKNELPSSLFETVCAFLNRSGGTILLGVSDNKTIEGIDPKLAEQLCKNIANLSNNPQKLFPSFLITATPIIFGGKTLIYVFVPISSQVHKCNGKIYDRSVDGDFELRSDEQIKQLYNRKSILYTENRIYPHLFENHFAKGIVERARRMIKINRPDHPWNDLNDMDFFITTGLYRTDLTNGQEGFTLSALLLFGRDEVIQSAIPHYKVDAVLRRNDLDRYDDRENIRCNLIETYDKLINFVAKHLPDKFYLEGDQRISLREKIFREIIANMLIHREYSNAYPSSLVIYNHRVETKNANKPIFIGQLLPGKFEPFPKNPNIAQIFTQMGRSEELGTGVKNVFKYSKAYSGSDQIVFEENDVFVAKVPLSKHIYSTDDHNDRPKERIKERINERITEGLNEGLSEGLNEGLTTLLNAVIRYPGTQAKKLSVILNNRPIKTIERQISELTNQKLIERRGSRKTGGYFALDKQNPEQ